MHQSNAEIFLKFWFVITDLDLMYILWKVFCAVNVCDPG